MPEHSWAKFCQNAWAFEASRMISLNKDAVRDIFDRLPVLNAARIIDIGCGTGLFTECLARHYRDCSVCGLDIDEDLIRTAQERTEGISGNTIQYITGDGMHLPLEDNQFDLTACHTYLTSVPDPARGLAEMIRITRPGGYVASVSAQSFKTQVFSPGNYKKDYREMYYRYCTLRNKIEEMYLRQFPPASYINVQSAEKIPQLFGLSGLRNISMYPIGYAFSLSDCRISAEQKKNYIKAFAMGEKMKLQEYEEAGLTDIPPNELDEYRQLISLHKQHLLASIGENTVWEWMSGLSILMIGQKTCY
ncbi:MAG: class I SAM-dependent methyltransferase [Clostridia bacterium]|nr:class I SAM-dependent methyltransferase [Clostridia bacterium]